MKGRKEKEIEHLNFIIKERIKENYNKFNERIEEQYIEEQYKEWFKKDRDASIEYVDKYVVFENLHHLKLDTLKYLYDYYFRILSRYRTTNLVRQQTIKFLFSEILSINNKKDVEKYYDNTKYLEYLLNTLVSLPSLLDEIFEKYLKYFKNTYHLHPYYFLAVCRIIYEFSSAYYNRHYYKNTFEKILSLLDSYLENKALNKIEILAITEFLSYDEILYCLNSDNINVVALIKAIRKKLYLNDYYEHNTEMQEDKLIKYNNLIKYVNIMVSVSRRDLVRIDDNKEKETYNEILKNIFLKIIEIELDYDYVKYFFENINYKAIINFGEDGLNFLLFKVYELIKKHIQAKKPDEISVIDLINVFDNQINKIDYIRLINTLLAKNEEHLFGKVIYIFKKYKETHYSISVEQIYYLLHFDKYNGQDKGFNYLIDLVMRFDIGKNGYYHYYSYGQKEYRDDIDYYLELIITLFSDSYYTKKDIDFIIDNRFTINIMYLFKLAVENELNKEMINKFVKKEEYDEEIIKKYIYLMTNGFANESICELIDKIYVITKNNDLILYTFDIIGLSLKKSVSFNDMERVLDHLFGEIQKHKSINLNVINVLKQIALGIWHLIDKGVRIDEIKELISLLDSKFNEWQMEQIRLGIENLIDKRLSVDEIKEWISWYADTKFNEWQMREIRLGIEYLIKKGVGVKETKELISLYADTKFNRWQMIQILSAIKSDLSKEHIKFIANPNFSADEMAVLLFMFSNFKSSPPVSKNKFLVFI